MKAPKPEDNTLVVTGKLYRVRKGRSKRFSEIPPAMPQPFRRPARTALMLALAHKIQDAIDRGVVTDRAEVAHRLGLTRARITQLMDLTLLTPKIQEQILSSESVDGVEPMSARTLRTVVKSALWSEQLRALAG
jgi:hypothetical protein